MFCPTEWKFTLEEKFVYKVDYIPTNPNIIYPIHFSSVDDKIILATIEKDGTIYVNKGYSWDGATPKFCLFGVWFGAWDGPINKETQKQELYYPTLIHDVLCQFYDPTLNVNPFKLSEVDEIFLNMMTYANFGFRSLYYKIVRFYHRLFVSKD